MLLSSMAHIPPENQARDPYSRENVPNRFSARDVNRIPVGSRPEPMVSPENRIRFDTRPPNPYGRVNAFGKARRTTGQDISALYNVLIRRGVERYKERHPAIRIDPETGKYYTEYRGPSQVLSDRLGGASGRVLGRFGATGKKVGVGLAKKTGSVIAVSLAQWRAKNARERLTRQRTINLRSRSPTAIGDWAVSGPRYTNSGLTKLTVGASRVSGAKRSRMAQSRLIRSRQAKPLMDIEKETDIASRVSASKTRKRIKQL